MGRAVLGGAGWLGAARMTTQVVQFLAGLVLARLLTPAEFGLVASVSAVVGFGVIVVEGGFASALVHQHHPSPEDYSTVFWLNVLGGLALAGGVWLASPLIADFYGQPALTTIGPVIGLTFALSTGVVHSALLRRQLRFKVGALIEASSTVLGLAVTLALALLDVGALSLAIGPVVAQAIASIAYAVAMPWRPCRFISIESIRRLSNYAFPLVGASAIDYWGKNADSLLIGRYLGPSALGFYNRAYNLMLLPVTQVTNAVGSAVSPALARVRNDVPRARSAYRRSLRALSALIIPAMVGLAALADGLVPLLWGNQWLAAVPLLQLLSLAGIPYCLSVTASWLYQAQERTGVMLKVSALWTAIALIGMLIGLHWGALGVAVAIMARYWVGLPFELRAATRTLDLPVSTLLRDAAPVLAIALGVGAAVWFLPLVAGLERAAASTVSLQVGTGIVLQVLLSGLLNRRVYREVLDLLRSRSSEL